jgi:hypothetical protein
MFETLQKQTNKLIVLSMPIQILTKNTTFSIIKCCEN